MDNIGGGDVVLETQTFNAGANKIKAKKGEKKKGAKLRTKECSKLKLVLPNATLTSRSLTAVLTKKNSMMTKMLNMRR